VRFAPPALAALVHPRFAHSERPEAAPAAELTLARTGDGYALLEQGRAPVTAATDLAILGEFVRRFVELSHPPTTWVAVLHAAALGDPKDSAVVLPGANGRGKSTLVCGLLSAGYRYLSDDCAPLDRQGRVVPVPFGLCLKEPSWEIAAPHFPGLRDAPLHRTADGRRCRFVPPPPDRPAPLPLATIVFPTYVPGAACHLDTLDPAGTLRLLVEGRAWLSRGPDELRAALGLIERTPAFTLRYGDLDAAVGAIRRASAERHAAGA
jgi:hypothetical protein